ncbi:HAUS augmin-like complex subunit 5 isoform X2 [Manacus candei]|uniref:HAUS augmin-like complex subunit 5 isoform X2 n=1 Tax=Manacus candei TaxID=415023 RepID=UPI002226F9A1|nr:HAUS augmin-like complex subunit 5 isoform X2 [Manacus candei]
MMAAALDNWLRTEMELQSPVVPPPAVLRRLCSGPGAPVWEFIIRHVKNSRNVKKIRGNLLWYQQELETAVSPPGHQEALREAVSRMRAEVRRMDQALGGAQEAALRLEESLRAGQSRLWAERRRGAELRLLGAEPVLEGLRGLQGALRVPRDRPHRTRAELSAAMAMGAEPEVLTLIRSLCMSREGEEFLEPRPPNRDPQELRKDWLEKAEAELGRHHPEEVLWALEALANHSTRMLRASSAPSPEAPPTTKELIQECWMLVGGIWGSLPPLIFQLNQLQWSLNELVPKLGGDPKIRLALTRAYLGGVRGSLTRRVQELRGGLGDPQPPPLGVLQQRLRRGRRRVLQRQRRLRLLSAATRGRQALLRILQGQVRSAAGAGPGSAPPLLEREGRRRRLLLGALGALGEPLPHPGPSPPDSLRRSLGLGTEQPLPLLLHRVAELRHELRRAGLPKKGAGLPKKGEEPPPPKEVCSIGPRPCPGPAPELLQRLRLVSNKCQECLEAWPRLLDTVSQWWDLPAQHIQATPPGHIPFSHWLERWRGAVLALATPTPEEAEEPAEPRP